MNIKKNIPNFITCLNLLSGSLAILLTLKGYPLTLAAFLIGIGAILDFMDGMFARLLKAYSPIGKSLDSLADMVSFGLAPGFIMYELINQGVIRSGNPFMVILGLISFLIPVFSALRLANFNVDARQTTSFIGLPTPANAVFIGVPTPANAVFIASLPLILENDNWNLEPYILNPYLLAGLSIILSYLLVAEIPLFSLKFKSLGWRENSMQYIFLGLSVIVFTIFFYTGIPIIIFLYVVLSILNNLKKT
jgi:CDP-diacylglycerol---serine O-phosphatidyltransferase